jgi:hypothetical protein
MRVEARLRAEQFTWKRFRSRVVETIRMQQAQTQTLRQEPAREVESSHV